MVGVQHRRLMMLKDEVLVELTQVGFKRVFLSLQVIMVHRGWGLLAVRGACCWIRWDKESFREGRGTGPGRQETT